MDEKQLSDEAKKSLQNIQIIDSPFSKNDFEVFDYNIHLDFSLFIWPVLFRICLFWDSMNGYGFALGPIYLVLRITPMTRLKQEILRSTVTDEIILSYCCQKSIKFDHKADSYKTAFICNGCKQYLNEKGGKLT